MTHSIFLLLQKNYIYILFYHKSISDIETFAKRPLLLSDFDFPA